MTETINWLLEEDNPSVRYFTLRDILDLPDSDAETARAKKLIMDTGAVPEILRRQREEAYRQDYGKFYTAKYKGLVWSLIVLAELGAVRTEQIDEQCRYLFENAQETADGGFSMHASAKNGGGRQTEVIPCLTGNMVWSLLRLGYLGDPGLDRAVRWLTRFMRFNDGVLDDPQVPPYDKFESCWGDHTCHMGVVKALKALALIPEEQKGEEIRKTIASSVEFLLIHHIHKRSHNLDKVSKPGWLKLGFPLMYQTDVLEILDILTAMGVYDERMGEAVSLVKSKQDGDCRWKMENAYALLVSIEEKGKPSKWVTLRALRVLKRWEELASRPAAIS